MTLHLKEADKLKVLSFGGGLQTTALAILIAQGKVKCEMAVFADTGAEKPETYWYMENYIVPLFREMAIPLLRIRNEQPHYLPDLYSYMWRARDIPSVNFRRCTDHYKIRVIKRWVNKREVEMMIGFSLDEAYRANRPRHAWALESYPLIDLGMTSQDCHHIITNHGFPVPIKSACYFCPFTTPFEWQWLKNTHRDLFEKALALEANYHERKPEWRDKFGLYRGLPLRWITEGKQMPMGLTLEQTCWDGHCGH